MQHETTRLFDVTSDATGLVISFERCLKNDAVLRMRRAELCRGLLHAFRLIGPTQAMAGNSALRVRCDADRANLLHTAWPAVMRRIQHIASRPCTPRMLTQLLGIEPQECTRWTQDGRLRTAGQTCPNYPAQYVSRLADQPQIIDEWRRADAEVSVSTR